MKSDILGRQIFVAVTRKTSKSSPYTNLEVARCPSHPRWEMKRKPTGNCLTCQMLWAMVELSKG